MPYSSVNWHDDGYLSSAIRKPTIGFPNKPDTNQAVQPQKTGRGPKFCLYKVEELYYPYSENKGVFVFAYTECWFSHHAAHLQNNGYVFLKQIF